MSEIFCIRQRDEREPIAPRIRLDGARIVLTSERGPAGPTGPAGGAVTSRLATAPLSGHRLVYAVDAQQVALASCDDLPHFSQVLGLALGAAAAGSPVDVQRAGQIQFEGWSFTPGPVLLGMAGMPVQALPVGARYSLIIGFAVDATTLYLDIGSPIILEA